MTTNSKWMLRNPFDFIILPVASRFGEKSKEVERFLKFVVVGVFGALVDFGTVYLLQATLFPPTDPEGNRLVLTQKVTDLFLMSQSQQVLHLLRQLQTITFGTVFGHIPMREDGQRDASLLYLPL